MLDEKEAHELIAALKAHLPLRAYASPSLAARLNQRDDGIKLNEVVQIDAVLYLGDEGGVGCALAVRDGKTAVVTSITHLRFDGDHPLARRIQAYQLRRTQLLAGPISRSSKKARARLAAQVKAKAVKGTKAKQKRAPVAPRAAAKKIDVRLPFFRACEFWISGEYQHAVDSFLDVLDLDPDDHHCSRYWLASCLFQLESFDELDLVLRRGDDQSGVWRFAQALAAFRRHGDTEDAQRLLVEADHLEPGFEHYLLEDQVVDASREVRFNAGDAERAFGCARLFLPAWRATPGAAAWARRVLKVPLTRADPGDRTRHFPRAAIKALPLRREMWQVGFAPCPGKPQDELGPSAKTVPQWLFGVANLEGQEFRFMTVIDQPLTETVAWNQMIQSLVSPIEGEPARPATLIVGRRDFCEAWKPLLADIGVGCKYESDPQPVGLLLDAMGREMEKQSPPPAADLDIRELPQSEAVWQTDFIHLPTWVTNEQEGTYRPWGAMVVEKTHGLILSNSLLPGEPVAESLLDYVVRTMAQPAVGSPQRPRLVEVSDSDCYDHLRPRLEAAGVACRLVDELRELDDFSLSLAKSIDGPEKCALAGGKDVTRGQMESFYEAAEYYFQQAPWRRVPGEVPIKIRCDDPRLGERYAVVLGRTGVQLGLCVYDDWETTRTMLSGFGAPGMNRALAVCYDEAQIMAAVDLYLIERLGWPIATPEAWPAVMRLAPRQQPRSPNAEELVFLDACLRAIPDFILSKAASQTTQVETGVRPVELHLAWDRRLHGGG